MTIEKQTVVNCPKCGAIMQSVFSLGLIYKGGFAVIDTTTGKPIREVVCVNPNCEDGKFNANLQSPSEQEQ